MCCRLVPQCTPDAIPVRRPVLLCCSASAEPLPSEAPSPVPRCDNTIPFASIRLGLGLALTFMMLRCRLTLKTCAVPGTQHFAQADRVNGSRFLRGLLARRLSSAMGWTAPRSTPSGRADQHRGRVPRCALHPSTALKPTAILSLEKK